MGKGRSLRISLRVLYIAYICAGKEACEKLSCCILMRSRILVQSDVIMRTITLIATHQRKYPQQKAWFVVIEDPGNDSFRTRLVIIIIISCGLGNTQD